MRELFKIFEKLYLWQITIVIALFLLVLGFTGDTPYIDVELRDGRSEMAISDGVLFFLLGIILRMVLMLVEKQGEDK